MEPKPFYLSKTLWTNLIMGVLVQIPAVKNAVGGVLTESNIGTLFMVVNMILRLVTKTGVSIS